MSEDGIINHLPEISLRGERRRRCRHLRRRRRFFIIITIITEQGTTGTIFVSLILCCCWGKEENGHADAAAVVDFRERLNGRRRSFVRSFFVDVQQRLPRPPIFS